MQIFHIKLISIYCQAYSQISAYGFWLLLLLTIYVNIRIDDLKKWSKLIGDPEHNIYYIKFKHQNFDQVSICIQCDHKNQFEQELIHWLWIIFIA